ncbi:MAG: peptidoglycan DD-metalloendopeptidase family protein [Flavobacteriales bacterium]|nr:peptidoglycan DD-metalloendopeptidase family protein [Flavobacteriales bacterium]
MGGNRKWMIAGLGLVALVGAYVYVGVDVRPHEEYVPEPLALVVEDTIPDAPSAYGIPLEGFLIERGQVKKGQTFSDLLAPHGITATEVDSLVRLAVPVFDIHRMRAGHPYALIFTDDSSRVPAFFVYEADQVDHVIFTLRPPMAVRLDQRPVRTERKSVSVAVTGALWNDLTAAGADPVLALMLGDVFQWTLDFYKDVQPGNRFTFVYQEHTVDGERYGQPELLGVRFEGAKTKEAFRFARDSSATPVYYDAEGNSLRLAFLKAPLKFSRVSSGFSMKRFHPVQHRWKSHLGTDYAAPYGTPILAVGDGVVSKAGYTAGNGNYVKIRHNGVYETQYLHMRKILVKTGQTVEQGQTIGEVGSTGLATGPHVCFRFWKNGQQVDHRKEELPSAEPIPAEDRFSFEMHRDHLLVQLDEAEREAQRVSIASF